MGLFALGEDDKMLPGWHHHEWLMHPFMMTTSWQRCHQDTIKVIVMIKLSSSSVNENLLCRHKSTLSSSSSANQPNQLIFTLKGCQCGLSKLINGLLYKVAYLLATASKLCLLLHWNPLLTRTEWMPKLHVCPPISLALFLKPPTDIIVFWSALID